MDRNPNTLTVCQGRDFTHITHIWAKCPHLLDSVKHLEDLVSHIAQVQRLIF